MKLFDNLFNVNIQKLFMRGDIVRAYEKMYDLAETLAIHEVRQRSGSIVDKAGKKFKKNPKNILVYSEEISKYKEKRIEYHMNKMKELLKLREEVIIDNHDKNNRR